MTKNKAGWKKIRLGDDNVAVINGTTFCANDFDEILYLDTSSVINGVFGDYIKLSKDDKIPSRAKRAVKNNTIVYSTVRPNLQHFGIFKKPQKNVVVSTGFATIDVNGDINPDFLYYNLTQNKFTDKLHTIATNNVSSYPSINPSDLASLELEVPDIPTQLAIARTLSLLDDKIALNRRINTELETLAKTIYDYRFVQNRKANWEVRKLNKYCAIGSGFAFKPETYNENGQYKVITIKNVQDGILDLSSVEKTDAIPKKMKDFCKLKVGDVLISLTGNVGRMCFVDDETCLLNQRVGKLLVKDEKYSEWIYCLLQSVEQRTRLEQIAGGSSQANLSPIQAVDFELPIPDTAALAKFSEAAKPIFTHIIQNRQESAELARLRDFLLPLLMNGQVTIK